MAVTYIGRPQSRFLTSQYVRVTATYEQQSLHSLSAQADSKCCVRNVLHAQIRMSVRLRRVGMFVLS